MKIKIDIKSKVEELKQKPGSLNLDTLYAIVDNELYEAKTGTKNKKYDFIGIALGLTVKAGRVADFIRHWRNEEPCIDKGKVSKNDVVAQLGQLLWLVVAMCAKLEVPVGDALKAGDELFRKRHGDIIID